MTGPALVPASGSSTPSQTNASRLTVAQTTARDRLLAQEVRRLVGEQHRRRRIPTVVHLGTFGALRQTLTTDPAWDQALRTDLLVRLLDGPALVFGRRELWLTRGGDQLVLEDDLVWLRAAQLATGVLGGPLPGLVVVTRHGWRDVVSGAGRAWVRSRPFRPDAKR